MSGREQSSSGSDAEGRHLGALDGALRVPGQVVGRLVSRSEATLKELTALGRTRLLAALLAAVDGVADALDTPDPGDGTDRPENTRTDDDRTADDRAADDRAADGRPADEAWGGGVSAGGGGEGAGPAGAQVLRGELDERDRLTREEVADAAGVALAVATRLWRAVGFPEAGDGQRLFTTADVAALRDAQALFGAGTVDVDDVVALVRPMGQLLSRLAVAHTGLIGDVLGARLAAVQHEGSERDGVGLTEAMTGQAAALTEDLLPVLERTTVYVWRRHLASAAGREFWPAAEPGATTTPRAVGFLDISGFTRLSRTLSELELKELLDQFEAVVWDAVVENGGRIVKTVGDEVMFVADSAPDAADAVLTVLAEVRSRPSVLRVHAGLAWGPVLHRGGDVYGPVVNIAARLTGLAGRDTARVDEACATELTECPGLDLAPRAPRAVRGYDHLQSFELRRAHSG